MPRVTLRLSEGGFGTVLLDGKPLDTTAVAITSEAGEPTEVTVVLAPCEVDVEVDTDLDHMHLVRKIQS